MKTIFLTAILFAAPACAMDAVDAARAALDDGFPRIALQKLNEAFPDIKSEKADSTLLMARALVEDGHPDQALAIMGGEPNRLGRGGDFWTAQALAALGRWDEALELYDACAGDGDFPLARVATLGAARMLANLGRHGDAANRLQGAFSWPDAEAALLDLAEMEIARKRPEAARVALDAIVPGDFASRSRRDFLRAKSLALRGDDAAAAERFAMLAPLDASMAVAAVIGRAESLIRIGQLQAAESALEEFLATRADTPGLDPVFAALDAVYARTPTASTNELKRWSEEKTVSPRRQLAAFYLGRLESRNNRPDRAVRLLERVVGDAPANPIARRAAIELAGVRLHEGRANEALILLPVAGESPQADFLRGLALAAQKNPSDAGAAFLLAASDGSLAESALYNAAVCSLPAGESDSRAAALLEKQFPGSPKIAAFRLEQALAAARSRDPRASDLLRKLEQNGEGSARGTASLALAEWNYQQRDFDGARLGLQRVSTMAGADEARQSALAVFLADTGAPGSESPAIAAATGFLAKYEGSEPEAEVRMKLGELLFRKGEFAGARVQFEALARRFPDSPLEEPALFLAAQSASRLPSAESFNDALLLLEEVSSMGGSLALRARFEQAFLQNANTKPKEAIVILDRILASRPDNDTKASVLVEKGKSHYAIGLSDPAAYRSAIAVWKQVADDPAIGREWRNQALTRMGLAFEKLGDNDAAIASYYDAIRSDRADAPEFFWFYKAGFAAARLLEASKKWNEAIRVYELMGAAAGPRAEEIHSRINKIRLENFLWD